MMNFPLPSPSHRYSWTYLAFILHRLSGIALALFLPIHFLVLGLAIESEAALDAALAWTHQPLVKIAEWGLIVIFSLHLLLGIRVLILEWMPWPHGFSRNLKEGWVIAAIIASIIIGTAFIWGALQP